MAAPVLIASAPNVPPPSSLPSVPRPRVVQDRRRRIYKSERIVGQTHQRSNNGATPILGF
jgi:hypothetical protein